MRKKDLIKYITVYYKKLNCTQKDMEDLTNEIMAGKESLKVKELFDRITTLTTYKSSKDPIEPELKKLLKLKVGQKVSEGKGFTTDKNKDFTDSIFELDNNEYKNKRYIKFEMLTEYYTHPDVYKMYAEQVLKETSKQPKPTVAKDQKQVEKQEDKKVGKQEAKEEKKDGKIEQFKIGDEGELDDNGEFEDDEEDKMEVPVKKRSKDDKKKEEDKDQGISAPLKGLFGNIGQKDETNKVTIDQNDTEKDLINKLRDIDFSEIKEKFEDSKDSKDSSFQRKSTIGASKAEKKKLNEMVLYFLENFKKISDKKVVASALRVMRTFMFENNGSQKIIELKKHANNDTNIDLTEFNNATEQSKDILPFGTKDEKFVWLFCKLQAESFTVRINLLEKFIHQTTRKQVENRADELIIDLNKVYEDIKGMVTQTDPNKSFEIAWYGGKVKEGIRINKGSVEELVVKLKKFQKDPANKGKLMKAFEAHMDDILE